MTTIASELLVERLIDWGVDTVFGLPGDGINGIMEALRRHQDQIRFVLVTHEEAAAFMATGYAKSTGRLGVCLATSGPGGIHLLNGLYDAKLDHQPVLAITGMQETELLGTGYQQEVHLEKLFMDVAAFDEIVLVPPQIPALVDRAVKTALAYRTVAHLTVPNDVQIADADATPFSGPAPARMPSTAAVLPAVPLVPPEEDLRRAADVLNAGGRVVTFVGAGALWAGSEVLAVAERLASPIVKSLSGKAAVPDRHPLVTGGAGLLGTRPSAWALESCEMLFMVGTNFPYTKHLPEPGSVRVVQIDADPVRAGNRIPTEVPLVGDAAATLTALLPMLVARDDRSFLIEAQDRVEKWEADIEALEDPSRSPIQPQYLMRTIDRLADEDAVLTSDSGTIATWAARHFDIRGGRFFMLSGNLASMAPGLPYAIAAQAAFPGRQSIAFVGDGGFAMLMGEFMTAVEHRLPVKVFVANNGSLGQILWEQMVLGYPEYGVRRRRAMRFAEWARSCGGLGIAVDEPGEIEGAVKEAFAFNGAALVDVAVNPDEPPMPPKVTYEQASNFARAFLKGQPRKKPIATTIFRDKLEQIRDS